MSKKTNNPYVGYPYQQRLCEFLKQEKSKGITLEETAKALNLTRQTLTKYRDGENAPDVVILGRMADYFGVSTDYLLGRTETQNSDELIQAAVKDLGISEKSVENIKFLSQSGWNADILLETEHFGAIVRKLISIDEWTSYLNYFNQVILPSLGIDKTIYECVDTSSDEELESIRNILNDEFLKIVKEHIGGENIGGKNIPYRGLEYEEKIDLFEFRLDKDVKSIVEDIKLAHKMDYTVFANYNKFICDVLLKHRKKIKRILQNQQSEAEVQKYKKQLEAINAFLTKYGEVPPQERS